MAQLWQYYIPVIIQRQEGRIGLSAKVVNLPRRIASLEDVVVMIDDLTAEVFPDGPPELPEGILPVVPITWTLIIAQQGSAVKPTSEAEPPPTQH